MTEEIEHVDENVFHADSEVSRTVRKPLLIEAHKKVEDPRQLSSPTTELLTQFEQFDVQSPKVDFASPFKPRALRFTASPMLKENGSTLEQQKRVSKRNRDPLRDIKASELNSASKPPILSDEKHSDFIKPQPSPPGAFLQAEFPSLLTAKTHSPGSNRICKKSKNTNQFSFDDDDTAKLFSPPSHFNRSYSAHFDALSDMYSPTAALDVAASPRTPLHLFPLLSPTSTTGEISPYRRTFSSPPDMFDNFFPRPSESLDPQTPELSPRSRHHTSPSAFTPSQLAHITEPEGILPSTIQNCVKHISCATVAKLIRGEFKSQIPKYMIVDCRYGYEFKGGHIKDATNINLKDGIQMLFERHYKVDKNLAIIFHCEFSQNRAPKTCKFFRQLDREANEYPNLSFPELCVIEGGYSKFYKEFPELCSGKFVSMWDENHQDDCRLETIQNRRSWDAKAPPRKLRRQNSIAVSTPSCYATDDAGIHKRPSTGSSGNNSMRPSGVGSNVPSSSGRSSGVGVGVGSMISSLLNTPRSD